MSRISAGGNLSIDIQPTSWRLLANGADTERALVEAASGEPLRYLQSFGSTRRLPDTGVLPTQYIQRVVLGWSNDDETWHLGFLLEAELAAPRGSRWCEIANWPDPDGDLFVGTARQAGETLAQTMARPFYFVPARPHERAADGSLAPLPELPDKIDDWTISSTGTGQIDIARASQKRSARVLRAIWYLLLSILYFALSGLTLTSGIALPRPEFLPIIGIVAAVILFVLALRTLLFPENKVDRIVVHPEAKAIRGLWKGLDRWRYESDELKAVYVTQVVQKPRRNGTQVIPYGELNLQLNDGSFHNVLQQGGIEIEGVPYPTSAMSDAVISLTPELARSGLQALGLHVAQMLGLPCLYDRRKK